MFVRKSCNVLFFFITFIEIVYSTTLYYLTSRLIMTLENSDSHLSLHSSNSFAFDFSIVIIIVEMLFTNFDTMHTIDFLITLLILLRVLIELPSMCSSTIRRLSFMFIFKIV